MFKPHYGECSNCLQKRLIVVKKMLCKKCNEDGKRRNIRRADIRKEKDSNKGVLDGTRKAVLVNRAPQRRGGSGDNNIHSSYAQDDKTTKGGATNKRVYTKKKRKPILYRRKPSGELAVFQEIANGIEAANCSCCKKGIANLGPINFSHVVPKSIAPGLRLDKRNIWICCAECHQEYEFGDRNQEKFKEKNEQAEKLKQEYYGQRKTKG